MPANTVDLDFADGNYLFALPLPRITELQEKTGVGIGRLFARVLKGCYTDDDGNEAILPAHGEFYVLDLVETIRQALIGGGRGIVNGEEIKVNAALADRLIKGYVETAPLAESWKTAAAILATVIVGFDPPKKD